MSFLLIEKYCVQPGAIDTRLDIPVTFGSMQLCNRQPCALLDQIHVLYNNSLHHPAHRKRAIVHLRVILMRHIVSNDIFRQLY